MRVHRMPDGTVLVSVKERGERRVERVTMALLVLWLGAMLIAPEPEGTTPLGFGAILLGSGFYRRMRGWHAGLITWVIGAVLVGVGVGDLAWGGDFPWFGTAVVLAGIWLLARALSRT